MKQIIGRYATAIVYTDIIEETATEQIRQLCDQSFVEGCRIRIMPDVHAGTGCVIGFTADLGERVIPNIVGVDIGCGMLTVELGKEPIDCAALDQVVREFVPAGSNIHETPAAPFPRLKDLLIYNKLKNIDWIENSLGTLGGGNHFIEVDIDDEGMQYLVIHTGSRNLGKQVADYYQETAVREQCRAMIDAYKAEGRYQELESAVTGFHADLLRQELHQEARRKLIAEYKAAGRAAEIQQALESLNVEFLGAEQGSLEGINLHLPRELCYVTGENRAAYLHDMAICQEYASMNRRIIADRILTNLLGRGIDTFHSFQTIHNYIDHESNIIRKGAVSAKLGEQLLIPINMRDGSLICIGKGNPEWNCSAPHGAGRLFSRGAARHNFTVEAYAQQMQGIYTTSVSEDTLDECPMAYKPMESIVANIAPTATIQKIIRPVYNFKAGK
ncbi:MAG: RtcB family protein [Oscillospiraceae bacterium]|nr:RtcB family protein [Oscillospiraceae bacterium]